MTVAKNLPFKMVVVDMSRPNGQMSPISVGGSSITFAGVRQDGTHVVIAERAESGGWTDSNSGQEYERVVMQ